MHISGNISCHRGRRNERRAANVFGPKDDKIDRPPSPAGVVNGSWSKLCHTTHSFLDVEFSRVFRKCHVLVITHCLRSFAFNVSVTRVTCSCITFYRLLEVIYGLLFKVINKNVS